jgi:Rrf2 family protein
MNLINKETDYALRALMAIACCDQVVSSSFLDQKLGLPRPILRKVLQVLQKQGFLYSTKGHKGGFQLSRHPRNIFLIDLIKIFQGDFTLLDCFFRTKICPNRATCPIRMRVLKIEKKVFNDLKLITLAQLIKDQQQ